MSQDREKYLYFTVGLLKDSATLDVLWKDALKYHMIDQPGKLIALRLTEHYEMLAQGIKHPGEDISMTTMSKANNNGNGNSNGNGNGHYRESILSNPAASNGVHLMSDHHSNDDGVITASPDAEQNADDAAEYWSQL
ncbi:MAG: hypothetical protein NVSMB33_17490 [Ktedonobacteraceae bacterium]